MLLVLALTLGAAAAVAQPSQAPAPALRGPVQPPKAQAAPATPPPPSLDTDPLTGLLASRGSGQSPVRLKGHECRMSCASDLYQCREERDEVDCNPVWVRCVAGCAEDGASPL